MRKKPIVRTIPDVRRAPARPLEARTDRGAPYPTAAELVSSSAEWRRWLEAAMRTLVRPAALAGAVGLAATGCGSDAFADLEGLLPEDARTTPTDAEPEKEPVVMYPVSAPGPKGPGGAAAHPPASTPAGGSGGVVDGPLPDPPVVVATRPKPPVLPPTRPPAVRGRIAPVNVPYALAGDVPAVMPDPGD